MKLSTWILGMFITLVLTNIFVEWVIDGELIIIRSIRYYAITALVSCVAGYLIYKVLQYGARQNKTW